MLNHAFDLSNDETPKASVVERGRKGDSFRGEQGGSLRLRTDGTGTATAAQGRLLPDWSAVPELPLCLIARRLRSLMDFFSFRGVCTSWRAAGRAVERRVMASHPPLFLGNILNSFYHPGENRVYGKPIREFTVSVAGFSQGLLILYLGPRVWLLNPLTGVEIHCFPRITLPFCHALLSSPPTSPGCVLVVYGMFTVQYCRPGGEEWFTVCWPKRGIVLYDIFAVAFGGGKGYVLTHGLGLATFDFTANPVLTILKNAKEGIRARRVEEYYVFLAESNGEILVFITRELTLEDEFFVFRFDTSRCKWVRSEHLGGRTVFVDVKGPLFVDNYAEWGGSEDCIYFLDACKKLVVEYRVKDRRSEPFLYATGNPAIDFHTGIWVLPSLS